MCGIGGIILLDKRKSMDKETQINAVALLHELQDRGSNAWGVYLKKVRNNSNLYCGTTDTSLKGELFKTKDSVTDFFGTGGGKVYLDGTNLILMHTRAQTKGPAEFNENNHPFHTKNFILAHNGMISNDTEVIDKHKIQTEIKCDSYAIITAIQKNYESCNNVQEAVKEALKEITGSMACWLYHKDTGDIYLWRTSNPIEYYLDADSGIFVFASESNYLKRTFGLPYKMIHTLTSEKLFRLEKDKLVDLCSIGTKKTTYNHTSGAWDQQTGGITPTNLSSINDSLVYLYKLFEIYEKGAEIKTVIAIVRNDIILLAKPKQLISLLDGNGFKKYKKTHQTFNDDYHKYTITPKENINGLVKNLKKELDDASNNLEGGDDFYENLGALSEIIGCELEYDTESIKLSYPSNKMPNKKVIKEFSNVGLTFGETTKSMELDNNEYHRGQIEKLFNKIGLNGKQEWIMVEDEDD